jgi:hypothetical protein
LNFYPPFLSRVLAAILKILKRRIAPLMVTYHYVKCYVSIIIQLEVININVRNFKFPVGFYSNPQTHGFDPLYHKSENFRIHWKHISITLPSFMKFCPVVLEICRGQVHASRKERIRIIIIQIQIIIRNGAKAISLPNIIWET